MTDVVAIGDVVIGIGDYQGLQRGTATSWVSGDGIHWDQARSAPVQEQGEFYAITPGGPGVHRRGLVRRSRFLRSNGLVQPGAMTERARCPAVPHVRPRASSARP